jgi:hypothetical protein
MLDGAGIRESSQGIFLSAQRVFEASQRICHALYASLVRWSVRNAVMTASKAEALFDARDDLLWTVGGVSTCTVSSGTLTLKPAINHI